MRDRVCKCCGQTLPEELPLGIKFHGKVKAQILASVHKSGKHGIASERLFDILYGDDPNGGPEYGRNVMAVHVSMMNKILRKRGWRIWNDHVGRGPGGHYILQKIA